MKETSIEAYQSAKERIITDKVIILRTMNKTKEPMTCEQIADNCSLDYYQVSRRMSELERDSRVECPTQTGINKSGKKAYKWQIVE